MRAKDDNGPECVLPHRGAHGSKALEAKIDTIPFTDVAIICRSCKLDAAPLGPVHAQSIRFTGKALYQGIETVGNQGLADTRGGSTTPQTTKGPSGNGTHINGGVALETADDGLQDFIGERAGVAEGIDSGLADPLER